MRMQTHCNYILRPRLKTMARTTQLSIRLPDKAIEMIEEDLIPTGLYGANRAEVCKSLILSRLEQLLGEGIVTARRA
jgi:hypothetical protein